MAVLYRVRLECTVPEISLSPVAYTCGATPLSATVVFGTRWTLRRLLQNGGIPERAISMT